MSLAAVAQQAGVGTRTLYRHYSTREALTLALIREDITSELEPRLLAIANAVDPNPHNLQRCVHVVLEWTHGERELLRDAGCAINTEAGFDQVRSILTSQLDLARDMGALRSDFQVDLIMNFIAALTLLQSQHPSTSTSDIVQIFFDGLSAPL